MVVQNVVSEVGDERRALCSTPAKWAPLPALGFPRIGGFLRIARCSARTVGDDALELMGVAVVARVVEWVASAAAVEVLRLGAPVLSK